MAERALLAALMAGAVLKAHRTLDGAKIHKLHDPNQPPLVIDARLVRQLERKALIQSNMKFPASTYLLTEQGSRVARENLAVNAGPLVVRSGW
ncbi:MAG: hypothetical protein R2867_13505 [Caldilineaceae bacterium]